MKRKLVRQGKSTLTLSLPAMWIKHKKLNEGDEVEISEYGEILQIGSQAKKDLSKAKIDVSMLTDGMIWRIFMGLYRSGADEIVIKHNGQLKVLTQVANQFIGYAITNQEKDRIVISDLSGLREIKFESIFKRLYFILLNSASVLSRFFEEGKASDELASINLTTNQFVDYALRYLTKVGLENSRKVTTYSQIISDMEIIVDVYVSLAEQIEMLDKKEIKNAFEIHKKISLFVKEFYEQTFNFDYEKLSSIYSKIRDIGIDLGKIKNPSFEYHYIHIISVIKSAMSHIVLLNYEKFEDKN